MTLAVNIAVDYSVTTDATGTDLGEVSPFAPQGKNALLFIPTAVPASTVFVVQTNSVATAGDANWVTVATFETGDIGFYEVTDLQRYVRIDVTDAGTGTATLSIIGIQ